MFPLFVFISCIYFSSKMSARSEFVAILAGGVPYNRMLRPYVVGALLLGAFFWFAIQYLVLMVNEIRTNFQSTYIDPHSSYNGDPSVQ